MASTKDVPNAPLRVVEDEATGNRFLVYTTKGNVTVDLLFDGDEPWFTTRDIATMFGVTVPTASEHIQRFRDDGELDDSTIREFLTVRREGRRDVSRSITHYGLDVAMYVGFRVNSLEGRLFRRWATQSLVQLAKHGFVIDKRKLRGHPDRLRELRLIIADIRSDEANMYAELREICAMCQDYDSASPTSRNFFAHFQNRMLYAVTEQTAAGLIVEKADATAENMGLAAWAGDRVVQSDAVIAKNYLGKLQLEDLNRLVGMVLDFFEDQVKRGWLVSMKDADGRLAEILTVNRRHMLQSFGTVSVEDAKRHAIAEYRKFDADRKAAAVRELNRAASEIKAPAKPRAKRGNKT